MKFTVVRLKFVSYLCWWACVKKMYILRWRNWRLKYEGVQDRASKLYPGYPHHQSECQWNLKKKKKKEARCLTCHCVSSLYRWGGTLSTLLHTIQYFCQLLFKINVSWLFAWRGFFFYVTFLFFSVFFFFFYEWEHRMAHNVPFLESVSLEKRKRSVM